MLEYGLAELAATTTPADPNWVEKWGLYVAMFLAALGIITIVIGILQVSRAKDAVDEAKKANHFAAEALKSAHEQVDFARRSVEIAQRQNELAADSVSAAREQVEFARQAVAEAQAQSVIAQQSVEEARRQSEFSAGQLELARELRKDQIQPYLLLELDVSLRESQLLVVRLSNAGASAAHDVKAKISPRLPLSDGTFRGVIDLATLAPAGVWEQAIDVAESYFRKDRPLKFTVSIEGQGPFGPVVTEPYEIDLGQLAHKLALDSEGVLIVKALRAIGDKL